MHKRRLRSIAFGVAALLAVTAATAAAAAPGDPLRLGVANTIDAATTWSGAATSRLLQLSNTSAAAGARALSVLSQAAASTLYVQNTGTGPGIQISVAAGKAPISVNGTAGKATNLNADKLDGLDSTGFVSGPGEIYRGAVATGPGGPHYLLIGDQNGPRDSLGYQCPANHTTDDGSVMYWNNHDTESVNVMWDDGTSVEHQLVAPDGYWIHTASRTGDHHTIQVQGSIITTYEVNSVHRAGDCHAQAMAIVSK